MMGNMKLNHRFTVKHESCGVRRQREVNGVVIISTVIVSFHSIFITKVDRAYRLSCFYVEGTKRVQQQLDVAALTTQLLESQTQLPICRYDILSDGPNGIPVKYGRIGEMVFHKWTCVSELIDVYCMRVHSCTVYDGQGGSAVTVIDVNGCSVDSIILQNIDYLDDMTAGKLAQVFKFADRATLYFNCQIQLTIKDKQYGCSLSQPQCSQTYVQSSPIATEVTDYATSQESAYPTPTTEGQGYQSGYPTRVKEGLSYQSAYPKRATEGQSFQSAYPAQATDGQSYQSRYPTRAPERQNYQSGYPTRATEGQYRQGYTTTRAPGYDDESARYPHPVPFVATGKGGYESTPDSSRIGAPGIQPTYADLHPNTTENTNRFFGGYTDQNAYTRLIKRNVKGTAITNRSQPIAVADFDLPERELIVFGLEDGNGEEQSNDKAAQLVSEDHTMKSCIISNKILALSSMLVTLFVGLIMSLSLIIYKQRKFIIKTTYLKHSSL